MTATWQLRGGDHAVQYYDNERFLHRAFATFLENGLRNGDPCVMIARPQTFAGVVERLSASFDDPASRLVFVDVDAALAGFMDGLTPDPARFERSFANLAAQVGARGERTLWIGGEMVDVLCKAGNHAAAIQLEQMWNATCAGPRFAVMCAYALEDFDDDVHGHQFRAVCRQHTHVIPAEGFLDAPDDRARLEQVARLQQRVRALDGALAHEPARPAAVIAGTVYVVDDDVSVRRSLARLLGSMDLRLQTFPSAEAFLAEVDQTSRGCLVLDIQLSGMSGSDLQAVMARDRWSLPVIAMSGSHDRDIEVEALRLGAIAFLRKPFDAEALIDALTRVSGV